MNASPKNWSLRSEFFCKKKMKSLLVLHFLLYTFYYSAQITNYVNNGSFEELYDCQLPNPVTKAKYWLGIDSTNSAGVFSTCSGLMNAPVNSYTYQWPRRGNTYGLSGFFCPPPSCVSNLNRIYFKNRLKQNLKNGKTYCVKFHINISNNSTYGMDGFGAYFGDNSLDTISQSNIPLTYLIPQIQNPNNTIITDTLNWTLITGTFVATGSEKFMVIGNFKSDATTNSVLISTVGLPAVGTDVCLDDVSCIDIDLPAFAGHDTSYIAGTSVYIGRQQDVGIDEACRWYKLPNMTMAIDTAAGLWVSPTVTSTYAVRQEICGNIKWDTVVVHQDFVGINLSAISDLRKDLKLFPVPAKEYIELSIFSTEGMKDFNSASIYSSIGLLIREEEVHFEDKTLRIKTEDLSSGVYLLQLKSVRKETISKRFVIAR
jgi:hypothetical protein